MDNQEFAMQVVKFSQLEQLTSVYETPEEPEQSNLLLSDAISNSLLPGLIGKTAKAATNKIYFDGENPVCINFTVNHFAESANLTIQDLSGNIIKQFKLEDSLLSKGEHNISWDGSDESGIQSKSGEYLLYFEEVESHENFSNLSAYIIGEIQYIDFKNEGVFFVINNIEIKFEHIIDFINN